MGVAHRRAAATAGPRRRATAAHGGFCVEGRYGRCAQDGGMVVVRHGRGQGEGRGKEQRPLGLEASGRDEGDGSGLRGCRRRRGTACLRREGCGWWCGRCAYGATWRRGSPGGEGAAVVRCGAQREGEVVGTGGKAAGAAGGLDGERDRQKAGWKAGVRVSATVGWCIRARLRTAPRAYQRDASSTSAAMPWGMLGSAMRMRVAFQATSLTRSAWTEICGGRNPKTRNRRSSSVSVSMFNVSYSNELKEMVWPGVMSPISW